MLNRVVIVRWILILLILTWIGTAAATLVPDDNVSKPNRIGYKSICSYTPISTIILGVLAIAGIGIGYHLGYF